MFPVTGYIDLFRWANRQSSLNDHSVTIYSYDRSLKLSPQHHHPMVTWSKCGHLATGPHLWPDYALQLPTHTHLSPPFWPPWTLLSAPTTTPQMMFAVVFPGEGDNWASHPHCSLASYGLCPQLYPPASSPSTSGIFPSAGEGLLCTSRVCALMDPRPAGERWQRSARGSKVQGIQKTAEMEREIKQAEGVEPGASAAVAESHLPKGARQALLC